MRTQPKVTYFDIETGPLEADELESIEPVFTPARNLRDPVKIAADVEEKRQRWLDGAALSALTGRVLAIGYLGADLRIAIGDEVDLLEEFWERWRQGGLFIGFNVCAFDLPFLVRRSYARQVGIPADVRVGRYWSNAIVDLRQAWALGEYQAEGSLDSICRALGLGQKTGDGADFARLLEADPPTALAYVENDLRLTQALAERMGLDKCVRLVPKMPEAECL